MALTLEIVSPRGVEYSLDGVERVVVRRREPTHDPGSEIAIYPHHAPLLMQVQPCRLRISRAGLTLERQVDAGVLEVYAEQVTLAIT